MYGFTVWDFWHQCVFKESLCPLELHSCSHTSQPCPLTWADNWSCGFAGDWISNLMFLKHTPLLFFSFVAFFQHSWPGSHCSRLDWMPPKRQSRVSLSLFCYQSLQPLNSLSLCVSMGHVGLPAPICLGILWVTWMLGIFFNFQSMKVLYLNLLRIMFHYLTHWTVKSM